MKVKISFDVSRKGSNSSLPNTEGLHIQTHRFPLLHLRKGSLDSNKFYGILSLCFNLHNDQQNFPDKNHFIEILNLCTKTRSMQDG